MLIISASLNFMYYFEFTPSHSSPVNKLFSLTDTKCPYKFHGVGPHDLPNALTGCWCGNDNYCLCTPSLAIDTIVVTPEDDILMVQRGDGGGIALCGGYVQVGEAVEDAVVREVHEEMGVILDKSQLQLFGVYSDPTRDKRRHTVSVVYVVRITSTAAKRAKSGDDAKEVLLKPITSMLSKTMAFDHSAVLQDYVTQSTSGKFVYDKIWK